MTEEEAYETAMHEVQSGTMNPGILAKAMAFSEGDEWKANYLRFRAEHLLKGHRADFVSKRATQVSSSLSTKVGIGRLAYFITVLISLFIATYVNAAVTDYYWKSYSSAQPIPTLISACLCVFLLVLSIKRCIDAGISAWWSVPAVLTGIGMVILSCAPSSSAGAVSATDVTLGGS